MKWKSNWRIMENFSRYKSRGLWVVLTALCVCWLKLSATLATGRNRKEKKKKKKEAPLSGLSERANIRSNVVKGRDSENPMFQLRGVASSSVNPFFPWLVKEIQCNCYMQMRWMLIVSLSRYLTRMSMTGEQTWSRIVFEELFPRTGGAVVSP